MGKKKDKYEGASSRLKSGVGIADKDTRKAMERYGIDRSKYTSSGMKARGGGFGKGTYEDMENDLIKAARSDFDTRRAIEAAALGGDKRAIGFAEDGIDNLSDLLSVQDLQRKQHKELGNGGDFSSASDFAGLSYKLARQDRENLTSSFDDKYASKTDLENLTNSFKANPFGASESEEIVRSDRLQNAQSRLESAAQGNGGRPSLYGNEKDQQQAASDFLEDYKFNLMQGLK